MLVVWARAKEGAKEPARGKRHRRAVFRRKERRRMAEETRRTEPRDAVMARKILFPHACLKGTKVYNERMRSSPSNETRMEETRMRANETCSETQEHYYTQLRRGLSVTIVALLVLKLLG